MSPSVYLAGPIAGQSYVGATTWRINTRYRLAVAGIDSWSPMRFKDCLADEAVLGDIYAGPLFTGKGIVTRDRFDVMRCDLVLANFLGVERISIGTIIELGWADAWRKPIVIVAEQDNLHRHAMLLEIAGCVVETLPEAIELVIDILSGGPLNV